MKLCMLYTVATRMLYVPNCCIASNFKESEKERTKETWTNQNYISFPLPAIDEREKNELEKEEGKIHQKAIYLLISVCVHNII